jgi:hypothetical protein
MAKPPPRTPKPPAAGSRDSNAPARRSYAGKSSAPARDGLPRGIKIQLKGQRTAKEARAMVMLAFDELEARGIHNFRGMNFYLTPTDAHENPVTRWAGKEPIHDLVIPEPYPCAADEYEA